MRRFFKYCIGWILHLVFIIIDKLIPRNKNFTKFLIYLINVYSKINDIQKVSAFTFFLSKHILTGPQKISVYNELRLKEDFNFTDLLLLRRSIAYYNILIPNVYRLHIMDGLKKEEFGLADVSNILVIGPVLGLSEIKNIDNYDAFVLTNQLVLDDEIIALNVKKCVVFFNSETLTKIVDFDDFNNLISNVRSIFVKSIKDYHFLKAKGCNMVNINVLISAKIYFPFPEGPNALPNILSTLIPLKFKKIDLVGFNFWLGNNIYKNNYIASSFDLKKICTAMRFHDPISNFDFCKYLFACNLISVHEEDLELQNLMDFEIDDYVGSLDKKYFNYLLK